MTIGKKILYAALVLTVLLCGAAAASYLARDRIVTVVARSWLLPLISRQGVFVKFNSLTTDLFSRLTLRNATLDYPTDEKSGVRLATEEISLDYRLIDLLRDWREGLKSSRISARRTTVVLSAAGNKDQSGAIGLPVPPPWFPALRVTDGSLRCEFGARIVEADRLAFTLAASTGAARRIAGTAQQVSQLHLPLAPASVGRTAFEFSLGPGALAIQSLSVEGKTVAEDCRMQFLADGSLSAKGVLHLFGGTIDFDIDRQKSLLRGSVSSREVRLTEVGRLVEEAPGAMTGRLSLRSTFSVDLQQPKSASGELYLEMAGGRLGDLRFERLLADLEMVKGKISGNVIELRSKDNRLTLTGLQTSLVELRLADPWQTLRKSAFRLHFDLGNWRALAGFLPGEIVSEFDSFGCSKLSADVRLSDATLSLQSAQLQCSALTAEVEEGSIGLPVQATDWQSSPVKGKVAITFKDPNIMRRYLPRLPQEATGTLRVDAVLSGSLGKPDGVLRLQGEGLGLRPLPLFSLNGKAQFDRGAVLVNELEAVSGNDHLELQGKFPLRKDGTFSFEAGGKINSIGKFSASLSPSMPLTGDLSFSLQGRGTYANPVLSMKLQSSRFSVPRMVIDDGVLQASYDGVKVGVDRLQGRTPYGTVALAGVVSPVQGDWSSLTVRLRSLMVSGRHRLQLGQKQAVLSYGNGSVSLAGPVLLQSDIGDFTVSGNGGEANLDFRVKGEGLRMPEEAGELLGRAVSFDRASFILHLTGSPKEPGFTCEGRVANIKGRDFPASFDGVLAIVYDENGFDIRSLQLQGGANGFLRLSGQIPVVIDKTGPHPLAGPLAVSGRIELPDARLLALLLPEAVQSGGPIHADIALSGTLQHPQGHVQLQATDLLPAPRFTMLPPGLLSVDTVLEAADNRMLIERLRIHNQNLQVEASGTLSGNVMLADLVRLKRGAPIAGEIDLHGTLLLPELAWAAQRFQAVHRVSGRLASDFSLRGPFADPVFTADLDLSDGQLRSSFLPVLREIQGKAKIDAEGISISRLQGSIGGAAAELSGGIAFNDRHNPIFDLRLQGKNLLFFRNDTSKVRGDADLQLTGPYASPSLGGKVLLTEGFFGRSFNLLTLAASSLTPTAQPLPTNGLQLFSITEAPLKDARLNITVKSTKPFKINTNLGKGELRPDLLLGGTGELPLLTGNIFVNKGRMNLPAGTLIIDSGLIHLQESDPERPSLELSGSTNMMGYEITVKIQGPYDEPTITLASYPPLANEDLLQLLLTGRRPPVSGENGSRADMSRVAIYLGRELLISLFGMEYTEDESLLDRLQLDIGREITQQGDKTIEARFLLKDGFLSRNDAVYLSAGKDIWDDYNGGLRFVFRFR